MKLIKDNDPNHEGEHLNMEEFILIMKYVEQKNIQKPEIVMENSLPSIKNTSRSHMKSM